MESLKTHVRQVVKCSPELEELKQAKCQLEADLVRARDDLRQYESKVPMDSESFDLPKQMEKIDQAVSQML